MPNLQPVDESIFTSAPQRLSQTWEIARPAAEVWSELTGEHPLHWCRGLSATWTSERPFGVGTTRTAKVLGLLAVKEKFFIWEEGHRYAFYAESVNLPIFSTVAEDYVVEPVDDTHCRYTWTAALAPSALGKPGGPLNSVLFGSFFKDTAKYFNAS